MRDKWSDSDHLWIQFFHEQHIFGQMLCCLIGGTDHESGSDLVTNLFQIPQTLLTVGGAQRSGMQHTIMLIITGFVSEKISVGSGVEKGLIGFTGFFTDG